MKSYEALKKFTSGDKIKKLLDGGDVPLLETGLDTDPEILRKIILRKLQFNNAVNTLGYGASAGGTNFSTTTANKIGLGTNLAILGINAVDKMAFDGKNFGSLSDAIDTGVHGVSSALMRSGNPYAFIAGAALETVNFATKATGLTVDGFDVDINSTGYDSNLGHYESKSNRDFGAMLGLGGIDTSQVDRLLRERNEAAARAMKASSIANELKFEQEARMNSVDDVVRTNQMALAGSIDTSLLGN